MSAASAPDRTFLDRFLAVIPVAVALLALLSLLFWEAAVRKSPTIFTDELEWSQISRAIAATGHAARRGEPIEFKSLYVYVIAPAWWIHSTGAAYAAVKYLNTGVMGLTAVPTFLLARTMVSTRAATVAALAAICTSALYYAAFIVPEVLAYPTAALCAFVSIRALAGAGRRWTLAAIAVDLLATQVRSELITLSAAFVLAAVVLWVVGPQSQRIRRNWSRWDYVGAVLLLVGALIVLNRVGSPHSHEWATATGTWRGRFWSLGLQAASALALGLGLLPVVGGLASLWLPERRSDPNWRAFAAFTAAAIVTVWTYTAVKAAYLSTIFATRVEERNLIYLGPLLIVGTAVWMCSRRRPVLVALAAWGFTAFLVLYYGYQLDYPYFEAPGYGIAAMANRAFHWDQPAIRLALTVACGVLLLVVGLASVARFPRRAQSVAFVLAIATTVSWMLAGEITSSRGSEHQAKQFVQNLPKPLDWVDRRTHSAGTTYLGQAVADPTGLWLLEFWNRSLKHVDSLDATTPGPGPSRTPDLASPNGTLRHDAGVPYVLADNGVRMIGQVVERHGDLLLTRLPSHPWRLAEAVYGRSPDGWIGTDATIAHFGPTNVPGILRVQVGRSGFCAAGAPTAVATVTVGTVALNEQREAVVGHRLARTRFIVHNCSSSTHAFHVTPPYAVQLHVSRLFVPRDYGLPDGRSLGAQVDLQFTKR